MDGGFGNKATDSSRLAAELARIKAETDKLKAETSKIHEERRDLKRKLTLPWYKDGRAVLAVIAFGPLLFFYYKEFVLPFAKVETIKLARDLATMQEDLSRQVEEFKVKQKALQSELADASRTRSKLDLDINKIAKERAAVTSEKLELAKRYADLESTYNRLSNDKKLSDSDRELYAQRAASLEGEAKQLRAQNESFQQEFAKLRSAYESQSHSITALLKQLESTPSLLAADQTVMLRVAAGDAVFEPARRVPKEGGLSDRLEEFTIRRLKTILREKAFVLVTPEGSVVDVRLASQGLAITDPQILEALALLPRLLRYEPAKLNGAPISVWVEF